MTKQTLQDFKDRKIKAKKIFEIREINKSEGYSFVKKYHYLKDAKFFAKYSYGLIDKETDSLVGVATYANPQGASAIKGWIGTNNQDQRILELSRLCLHPMLNGCNASSFLLSNSMKQLKNYGVELVITLADSSRHIGSIYQVCNFKYYGLTNKKSDFYNIDGGVNKRETTKEKQGVWLPRTRKHRYAYKLNPKIEILYKEQPKPTKKQAFVRECCGGKGYTYDKRYGVYYNCPICSNEPLTKLSEEEVKKLKGE